MGSLAMFPAYGSVNDHILCEARGSRITVLNLREILSAARVVTNTL